MAQANPQAPSPLPSSYTATADQQNFQIMFSTATSTTTSTSASAMRLEIQALRTRCSRLQTERDKFRDALWNLRAQFSALQTHAEGLELENAELREGLSPMSTWMASEGWRFEQGLALEPSSNSLLMQEHSHPSTSISNAGTQLLEPGSAESSTSSLNPIPTITTQELPDVSMPGVAHELQQQPDHNLPPPHASSGGHSDSPLTGPSTASHNENAMRVSFIDPPPEIVTSESLAVIEGDDDPPPIYRIGPPRSKSKNKKGKRKETEKDVESSAAESSSRTWDPPSAATRSKRSHRDDLEHNGSSTRTSDLSSSSGHKRIRMDDSSNTTATTAAMPEELRSLPEDASSDRAKFDSMMQPQLGQYRFVEPLPPPPPPVEDESATHGQPERNNESLHDPSPEETLASEPAQPSAPGVPEEEGEEEGASGSSRSQKARRRITSTSPPPQPQTKAEFESISAPLPHRSSSSRRPSAAPSVVSTRSTRSRSSAASDTRAQRVKTHWDPSTGKRIQIGTPGRGSAGKGQKDGGARESTPAERKRLVISIRPKGLRGVRK